MPKLQQQAAKMTREAWERLTRTAAFVPEEKRDWVPQGKARTLHDILAECAVLPGRWHTLLLGNEPLPPPDRAGYERAKAELKTLDKIKAAGDETIARLCEQIEAIPDERLDEERAMPWGQTMTVADRLFICYWNLTYHDGQVNYLQMLLGDTEMH
jgi:uncharacterized damage-inducible protein DinB